MELILPCFAHLTCSHQYRKEKDKTKYSFLDQHKNKQTKNPPSSNISFSLILSYGLKIKIQDIQSICYNSESEGFYFWMEWVLFLQKHLFLSWDLLAMWIFYASLVRASAKMILFRRKGKQLLANFAETYFLWSSGRFPCSWQGWGGWIKPSSNPKHSAILCRNLLYLWKTSEMFLSYIWGFKA